MADGDGTWDPQRVLRGAPASLLVLDPDLMIVEASDAYLAATMTCREEIVGRHVFDVFPDDPDETGTTGVATARASMLRVIEHRVTDVLPILKYAIPRPDGADGFETRYWATVNAPVFTRYGALGWIVHRADDVTDYVRARAGDPDQAELTARLHRQTARMEAEVFARRRLLEQNQSLQAVLDSLDTIVVGCDRDGRAILTNRTARTLFAIPPGGEPQLHWAHRFRHFQFSDSNGNELAEDDLPTAMLLRGEEVQDMLIVAKPDHQAPRTFRAHGRVVRDGGRLVAVVALHEVTQQQRAARIKDCERLVAEVLAKPETTDDVLANAVELIGTMLGWSLVEFWTVDEIGQVLRRRARWHAAGGDLPSCLPGLLHRGHGLPGQAWHIGEPVWAPELSRHDGAERQTSDWRRLHGALAVPVPGGAPVLGVLACYSDNHEIPDDMRAAVLTGIAAHLGEFLERRRADQARAELHQTRDEYISLVGHELRTPLTTIQSCTDMLLAEPGMAAAERQELLEALQRRTSDLHVLIAKLLDVAGTRAGHVGLRRCRMDLVATARAAIGHADTGERDVTVVLDAPAEAIIDGDPERLRTVLDELLANALTWAPDHSTVGVCIHADPHTAAAAISNTGAPIPADQRERIFDAFYRTSATRHHGIPGLGLGLTLARAVVERHGGSLTVSQPEEAVTTFTLRLPSRRPII